MDNANKKETTVTGISEKSSCFLVKDSSLLKRSDSDIYQWLRSEGFKSWGRKGWFDGVDWIYINICSKTYAPGMPGIPITKAVGDHAITFEEFLQIWHIYKKYEGLGVLQMS